MRRLAIAIYPNFQLLDAAGPISAFEIAGRFAPSAYNIELVAPGGGSIASSAGVALEARPIESGPFDTIMVAGGLVCDPAALTALVTWLCAEAPKARRVASICTGAFILAEAGLLNGRRATTHWGASDSFTRRYPAVKLDADRIYIKDGPIWTSGGVTSGIDLALALIEEDLGAEIARRTAQALVVHQHRAGGQSQYAALPEMGGRSGRFAELIEWLQDHLDEPLTVEVLAARVGMSSRNFARVFAVEMGVTPAKAIERLRVESARLQVETCNQPIDRVAERAGFGDAERMRRAFLRVFGQPPQALRRVARRIHRS